MIFPFKPAFTSRISQLAMFDHRRLAALDFQVVHLAAVRFTIYQYKTFAQIISNPIWPHHRWWLVGEIYVQICKWP